MIEQIKQEIERRKIEDVTLDGNGGFASYIDCTVWSVLDSLLEFINKLQEPEVDLDTEISDYMTKNFGKAWGDSIPIDCIRLCKMARDFYSLGKNSKFKIWHNASELKDINESESLLIVYEDDSVYVAPNKSWVDTNKGVKKWCYLLELIN